MTNSITVFEQPQFGALAPSMARIANTMPANQSEYATGVLGGFGVVSIRGKIWRIKYQGDEKPVMRRDSPTEAASSLEVVLVRASPAISKIYYEGAYSSDSDAAPDCWSTNGVTPAAEALRKQSATCASCPKAAWGSKVTDQGKKTKACSDSRRLAVVPLGDLQNEAFGGPMLLRIPAASLSELAAFDSKMRALGYPLFSIGVRISFDINSEYQKIMYSAIRVLTEEEAQTVLAMRDSPQVLRILEQEDTNTEAAHAPVAESVFEQPPAQKAAPGPAPAPAPKPKAPAPKAAPAAVAAPPAPAPVAEPAPAPVAAEASSDDLDSMLDDLIGG